MSFSLHKNIATESSPPSTLIPWLNYEQSLTNYLQENVGEVPKLTVLKQCWCHADWWDKYVLGLKENESVLHREIVISAKGKQCWYARTIIPAATYQSQERFFARLNQESLGQLIFGNKEITRLMLRSYCITPQSIEYYWLKPVVCSNDNLWVRLAVFAMSNRAQFYLIEILLPDLIRVTNELA
jgi:chorismate lyase